jgi:Glycosyl hydrolase catalytic core
LRKLVTTTALALLLAGAGAVSASAAPRAFFGTMTSRDTTDSELARMDRGNLRTLRSNLYWPAVQQFGPGVNDWSRYDDLIGDAAAHRIRIFPTIYGSPDWAAAQPHHPPTAEHRDEFQAFVRAAVERYGPGGEYWTNPTLYALEHPSGPVIPIIDWQMWNEPNSPAFWTRRPSAKSYVKLLKAGARGVRSASGKARVVTAGLVNNPHVRHGVPMRKFLPQMYRAGARGWFDAISIHPYTRTPRKAMSAVKRAREILNGRRNRRVKIWITEIGWASSGQRTTLTVKPKVQAKYLRQMFSLAARGRKRYRMGGIIWYSFRDRPERLWLYRTGLLKVDGKAKRSWKSFVRFTGGRP